MSKKNQIKQSPINPNTFYIDCMGMIFDSDGRMHSTTITTRFTHDISGETLSLSDEKRDIMIVVPFEQVERVIKRARGDNS